MKLQLKILGMMLLCTSAVFAQNKYDLHIKGGTIYNGSGTASFVGDVLISNDRIAYVGPSIEAEAETLIDATGKAIAPGFINMLSWAYSSLDKDGRSLSDIKQGVTLEVFGEGRSAGPSGSKDEGDYVSFGQAMQKLENQGVSTNVASFLGAATVRVQTVGYDNRKATEEEFLEMDQIVEEAMKEGAMGIGSSLIYAPGDFADTDELIRISAAASKHGGMYISHMRDEGRNVMQALEELIEIAEKADIPAEIYHLKTSRPANWHLLDTVIERVEQARAKGLQITADMYTYNASSTGLTGVIPTWVQAGGHRAWMNRMREAEPRKRLIKDIEAELAMQPADGILMVGFNKDSLADIYRGKTIAQSALMRGQSEAETIIDLMLEDDSRIQCIYFSMSEENIQRKIQIPWMSFCSDAGSYTTFDDNFRTHPRAFGSFIRVLGKYSRDLGLLSLEEAVYKLSGFPATNLKLKDRGFLYEGYFADLVVFDPEQLQDHATFDDPLQFATGVEYVLVNGIMVLNEGEHTNKFPGRFVKGPGYQD